MLGRLLSLARPHVRVAVENIWRDKRFRFLVWLLATGMALWRVASGQLTLNEVLNHLIIEIIIALTFMR